jgi:hypothetical protein
MEMRSKWLLVCVSAAGLIATSAEAAEKHLKKSEVPAVVLDAVATKYPKARMMRFSEEQEAGKKVYEVAIESDGHKAEISVAADGAILVEERVVTVNDLPDAVRKGLASSSYAGANVRRVEMVIETKKPEAPTFELLVDQGGTKHELVFDGSGKLLKEEKVGLQD